MGYVIFLGILSFFFVFKIFYVLLQGSLDTRWMYMFMFLFVMMLTRFLDAYFKDREEAFYTKYLKTALMVMAGTVIVIVWGLYGFTLWRQWNVNAHELVMLKNHCLLASILVIIFTLTLVLPKIKYKIVILSVFIALEGLISFRNLLSTDAPLTKENLDYEAVERSDFFKALQEMDDSFYRVEFRTTQKENQRMIIYQCRVTLKDLDSTPRFISIVKISSCLHLRLLLGQLLNKSGRRTC